MTVTQIRRLYPSPVICNDEHLNEYCVGGALCLAHAEAGETPPQFPAGLYLADMLQTLNPALCAKDAHIYARRIIQTNDAGNFDAAWRLAHLALGDTIIV